MMGDGERMNRGVQGRESNGGYGAAQKEMWKRKGIL